MSTDTNTTTVDMDDLDNFETAFFNKEPKADEPETPEEDQTEDEVDEIEDDTLATEDEDEDEDDAEDEEEADEPDPEPEPKTKNRKTAKDRIEELVARNREAERREAALLKRLEALEAPKEVKQEKAPAKLRDELAEDAPHPDEEGEDGEAKYPLGEFDPKYIRDLTKYTIEKETANIRTEAAEAERQKAVLAAQEELQTSWVAQVDELEKELPDIRERLSDMSEAFEHVDPDYGEYLAATIMSCDAGARIMHYLSQNIGEAQKIVASGPAAATLAIGRLEARLTSTKEEPKRNTKQVSKAPLPPETRTRGAGSKFTVNADTDDLDAFEREFFKKK